MKKILILLLIAWTILWIFFEGRELVYKKNINDYMALAGMTPEEARSYVTGRELYEFIAFCRKSLPRSASYRFTGIEEGSLDHRRAVYYMYPCIEKDPAEYVLVFGTPYSARADEKMFARLDDKRYIIKKALVRGGNI